MKEEEMRQYRYLRKEISIERERMEKMEGDERAKRIEKIIAEKIERAETEAERIERYIADVEEPVVRMLMVERYIHGRSWIAAGRRIGWRSEDAARKVVKRYFKKAEKKGG